MRTLKEQWEEYNRMILDPAGAGDIQRIETRRAFYGGALCMFASMSAASNDSPTEDEGVRLVGKLYKELQAYKRDVAEGRA